MIDTINSKELFRSMKGKTVLVVGDIMIDAYLQGSVERISPEAPVPVVSLNSRTTRPGGAANVAMNLRALGADPFICAVTGDDKGRGELLELLEQQSIHTEAIIADKSRPTTTKFRIIGNKNHMLRVDEESVHDINKTTEDALIRAIDKILDTEKPELLILQDYNKGVLTKKVIHHCISESNRRNIITAVDPKKKHFNYYTGATIFKPNLKEFSEGINKNLRADNLQVLEKEIVRFQQKNLNRFVLLTLSEHGVCFSHIEGEDDYKFEHFDAEVREISDVSGAGDTVISVAGLAYAVTKNAAIATQLANLAGGLVCEYSGVVSVNKEALLEEFNRYLQSRKQ